jgi:serine/threonine protein kinase
MDSNATDSTSIEHAKKNEKPVPDLNSEVEYPPAPQSSVVDEGNLPSRASRRHTTELTSTNQTRTSRTLAMKCLRPQTRANMDQFMIGVEDLVNETAMLASLDHPNIIKLHGRAGGCGADSFRLSDGFFILLDRLRDSLEDRIRSWKKTLAANKKAASPSMSQIRTACAIADALSYLHSKNIVFRDLKPANVGFNSTGVLKLFDFGFAKCVTDPEYPSLERSSSTIGSFDNGNKSEHTNDETKQQSPPLLYERCGTVRYMAPEVGLDKGYSLPADVYSFGILLWEICSLKKPFDTIKTTSDFEKTVFTKGARPKLSKDWHGDLKDVMTNCWSTSSNDRPSMNDVKRNMQQLMQDREEGAVQSQQQQTGRRGSGDHDGKASLFRKLRRRSTLI